MTASLRDFLREEVLRRTPSCAQAMQTWQRWRAPYRVLSQHVQKKFARRDRRVRQEQWRMQRERNQEVVFQEIYLPHTLRELQERGLQEGDSNTPSPEESETADPEDFLRQRGIAFQVVHSESDCPVCQEEGRKHGVAFSCGHFLCTDGDRRCLQQFLSSFPRNGTITCPLCRVTLCEEKSPSPQA